jgi:hypothetical protein
MIATGAGGMDGNVEVLSGV